MSSTDKNSHTVVESSSFHARPEVHSTNCTDLDILEKSEIDHQYSNIIALRDFLANNEISTFRGEYPLINPIEINALEMIEAELANQGFTSLDLAALNRSRRRHREAADVSLQPGLHNRSEHCLSIAQRAAVETSLWRWRARRMNKRAANFAFFVQVHGFLVKWAGELSNALQYKQSAEVDGGERLFLHRPGLVDTFTEDKGSIIRKLQYLDEFAAFLLNKRSTKEEDPYQKGLDVVLKVLTLPGRKNHNDEYSIEPRNVIDDNSPEPITLCLPLSRETFFKELKRATQ